MSNEITFLLKGDRGSITINFSQKSIEDTINRFFGFLVSSGVDDLVIKSSVKNVLDGNWNSTFPAQSNLGIMSIRLPEIDSMAGTSLGIMPTTLQPLSGKYGNTAIQSSLHDDR